MKNRFHGLTLSFGDHQASQVRLKDQIGSGAFSDVYATSSPEYVAKIMRTNDPKLTKILASEKYSFTHLSRHPHLVYGTGLTNFNFENQAYACFLQEFCKASLFDLLTCFVNREVPESLLLEIAFQIASGLKELHTQNPPITHRDIKIENILIGLDGLLKICDFGSISTVQVFEISEINRSSLSEDIDTNTTPNYRSPEQYDLYSGKPLTIKIDLWALGCLLYTMAFKKPPFEGKLAVVNCHYNIPKESTYSENFISLLKNLLNTDPKYRINAAEVISYLQQFGLEPNHNFLIDLKSFKDKKQPKIKPKFIDTISKHLNRWTTKTKGWLLSALEENEEGPKQKYVRYLIIKAWQKPNKIEKFYVCLRKIQKKNIESCLVMLKTLIVLHNYFKKGPSEVLTLASKDSNPGEILSEISGYWKKIFEKKLSSQKDKKRTNYLARLVYEYDELLRQKLRLSLKNACFFEGNFSLTPFFKNASRSTPLGFGLVEQILDYSKKIEDFTGILMLENTLWSIQISIVLSIIDEAYCLISLLSFLVLVLKNSSNYIDGLVDNEKLTKKFENIESRFENAYKTYRIFFRKCKNLNEFQNAKDLVPDLKEDVINYIHNIKILGKEGVKYNMFKDLNNSRVIIDLKLPLSYGLAAKNIKLKEMIGAEEEYFKKSPLITSVNEHKLISSHPGAENNQKVDFTQFICEKNQFEDRNNFINNDNKYEQKMIFEGFNFGIEPQKPDKLMEIVKKDEAVQEIYAEFSHQGMNKEIFAEQSQQESKSFEIDPNYLISFENFTKYLHENKEEVNSRSESPLKETKEMTKIIEFDSEDDDAEHQLITIPKENKEKIDDLKALTQIFNPSPNNEYNFVIQDYRKIETPEKKIEEEKKTPIRYSEISELLPGSEGPYQDLDLSKTPNKIKQLFINDISKQLLIPYESLVFLNQVGSGSTSVVYLGSINNKDVALKKIKVAEINENNVLEFQREIAALVKLKPHPNLVGFLGVSYSETDVCIITEFCHGGTLFDLLHRKKNIPLNWNQRLKFSKDLANGIAFLHGSTPSIIHRDLKSLNLLLDSKVEKTTDLPNVKIADFGLARNTFSSNVEKMTGLMGTFHWMAPEIFENKPYSLKADIYSLGIILWEICSRETPYKSLKGPHAIMKYVTVDKGRPNIEIIDEDCPEELIKLFQLCWNHDPDDRPKIEEVLEMLNKIRI